MLRLVAPTCRRSLHTSQRCLDQPPAGTLKHRKGEIEKPSGRLQHQLEEIERAGQSITVGDVERYRLPLEAADPLSKGYSEQHKKLVAPLEKSFTKNQLVDILRLYEIEPAGTAPNKRSYASLILEKWGFPRPDDPMRTSTTKTFPLAPSQAFFLMHESNEFLTWARNNAVQLRFSPSPLSLKATGLVATVEKIRIYINGLQKAILPSNFILPINTTLPKSVLKAISTSHGTFVEGLLENQTSISYLRSRPFSLRQTQRAILKAAYLNEVAVPPLFYHQVEDALSKIEAPMYSVLPFSPLLQQGLLKDEIPTYRIACVNGPISGVDQILPIDFSNSLATMRDLKSAQFDFRKWLHDLKPASSSKLVVKASPGHILLEPVGQQPFTVSSPLGGEVDLESAINWTRRNGDYRSSFHPCVPSSIYGFQTSSHDTFQRLEYSAVSTRPFEPETHTPTRRFVLRCQIGIQPPLDGPSPFDSNLPETHPLLPPPDYLEKQMRCEVGWFSDLDVMLPDRPTDLRFTASQLKPLSSENVPVDLKKYALSVCNAFNVENEGATKAKPDPPLSIVYNGQHHVLTSFNCIRQNKKQSRSSEIATLPFEVVTEIAVEVENSLSNGHSTCEVICDSSCFTDVHWDWFMRRCEWLTHGVARTKLRPLFEEDFTSGL